MVAHTLARLRPSFLPSPLSTLILGPDHPFDKKPVNPSFAAEHHLDRTALAGVLQRQELRSLHTVALSIKPLVVPATAETIGLRNEPDWVEFDTRRRELEGLGLRVLSTSFCDWLD